MSRFSANNALSRAKASDVARALVAVFGPIVLRLWCEVIIVVFKIHEAVERLADVGTEAIINGVPEVHLPYPPATS